MVCGNYKGTYIGEEICGFKKNHMYEFNLSNNGRTYELKAYKEIKTDKKIDVRLFITYASEISIKRNWKGIV